MALNRQAKVLSRTQVDAVLAYLSTTRYPARNRTIFLLSIKAGLRAKEIASLRWAMVTDAEGRLGTEIHLTNEASKGRSGRVIPINKDLRSALLELKGLADRAVRDSPFVITTERSICTSPPVIVNTFARWFRALGFTGASSHSGRRTAITMWARRVSTVGGSLRDVQILAGHADLSTTQRYIARSDSAQRQVVDLSL